MIALRKVVIFLNIICFFNFISCYIAEPGPTIKATKGQVWPKPQQQIKSNNFYIVRPQAFEFRVVAENCGLLESALQRYSVIINGSTASRSKYSSIAEKIHYYKPWRANKLFAGYLDNLNVLLTEPCNDNDLPSHTMKEQYILNITSDASRNLLSATTIWGILRGLETFSQLLHPTDEDAVEIDKSFHRLPFFSNVEFPLYPLTKSNEKNCYLIKHTKFMSNLVQQKILTKIIPLQINFTTIFDYPRFSHRGLLVDTSRHFIPMPKILKTLDAMSYNKLNVFHWHITDDQSFPYQSLKYPELSEKGAYSQLHVYSSSDVQKVISYAAARGIRVVVEFDTPGHTRSWGEAIPQLLTPCYKDEELSGQYGPIDPTKDYTYSFLQDFFEEVVTVFPDQYLHLGGDEVEFECWKSNPNIQQFMLENNITTYTQLEYYYIQRLLNVVENLKAKTIVWEEVFTNGVKIPTSTMVHVWKDWGVDWTVTVNSATKAGHPVLLSACWYLDHLLTGGDWIKYYDCEPYNFDGTDQQKKLVIGGEACMWAEVVNEYNIESRVWPRASATAEKLWSAIDADTSNGAAPRLEEHTCRMNKRGIGAQPPNSAGFCLQN